MNSRVLATNHFGGVKSLATGPSMIYPLQRQMIVMPLLKERTSISCYCHQVLLNAVWLNFLKGGGDGGERGRDEGVEVVYVTVG